MSRLLARCTGALTGARLDALWCWLVVPLSVAFAALVEIALLPRPAVAPFVFFYFAVALSAWLGGPGPGLLSVVMAAATANYLFVDAERGFSLSGSGLWATGLFILSAAPVALLCAALREAALRAARANEALRRQSDLLRLSHDGIFVFGLDGPIETWNRGAEEMYGWTEREALGRDPHGLLQTVFPEPLADVEAQLRGLGRWNGTLVHRTRDGRTLTVSARFQLVHEGDGVARVLETNRDITDRALAEERILELNRDLAQRADELRDADRRKDEFLAVLSHELRNPLMPIKYSLHVLDRVAPDSDHARRARAVIEHQVTQMTRLVEDLLDIGRIKRGKVRLETRPLDFAAVVRRTADDLGSVFQARGITLETRAPEHAIIVEGDEVRLAEVVSNLLHNAAKFTGARGRAEVAVEEVSGEAVLSVRDDGVGIAPEMLSEIWNPFTQGCDGERSAGGLGLGLALVKGLVELHGGSVAARSDGIGRGAELEVRLPRAEAAAAPRAGRELVKPHARRVLIIEDNIDVAESLREALSLDDHEVLVAHDGPSGIETARASSPEIVLCDIGLPGMDGYEVARAFRADDALRGSALVALTGYALAEDRRKALEAGFDRHLAKPPDVDELERLLAELALPPAA